MSLHWVAVFLALLPAGTMSQKVTFETAVHGDQSGIEERREVVLRTAAQWKALWREHAPDAPMPPVDLSTSMVIAVFSGTRSTAGHRATITSIERDGGKLVVTWREEAPGPGEILSQVLTFPFHIVRTASDPAEVVFKRVPARR